jgi:O-antigen/teichoic acid export membrane protein
MASAEPEKPAAGERPDSEHAPERKVARNFVALAGGDAVARVVAFLAGAYVARHLGPGELGAMLFASAVLLYFQNLSECGIDLLGVRHVAEDVARIERVAPAILGARVVVSCTLAALVFGLGYGLGAF